MSNLRPQLGICQWFHYQDRAAVKNAVRLLERLGARHLRTGCSWADYHRPGGRAWYDWQMDQLAGFEVLLSVWHTPPSLAEGAHCAGPPRRLKDYGEFIGLLIDQYGHRFSSIELWNEPNNRMKWAFDRHDQNWAKFAEMIRFAGWVAQSKGKRTVLGGMIPIDHHWLQRIEEHGGLEYIDVVAIHGFPEMWWSHHPNWDWFRDWRGWQEKIKYISRYTDKPIWITETGLATWDAACAMPGRHELQCRMLREAAAAPAERMYWYSLVDLDPAREAIEGFHVDENEYHLGLVTSDLASKPAYHVFQSLLTSERHHEALSRRTLAARP